MISVYVPNIENGARKNQILEKKIEKNSLRKSFFPNQFYRILYKTILGNFT